MTFALFLPIGAIVIRTIRNTTWLHAGWMSFCFGLLIAQLGMGIWMALDSDQFDEFHCQIGIVVITLLVIQPITGWFHHLLFKKTAGRSLVSYAHIWFGIALITLGIINSGLGLQLSHEKQKSTFIVYGVLAGVVWLIWMVTSVVAQLKDMSATAKDEKFGMPGSPA